MRSKQREVTRLPYQSRKHKKKTMLYKTCRNSKINVWFFHIEDCIQSKAESSVPFLQIAYNEHFKDILEWLIALLHSTIHVLVFFNFSEKNLILPHKISCNAQCCWKLVRIKSFVYRWMMLSKQNYEILNTGNEPCLPGGK